MKQEIKPEMLIWSNCHSCGIGLCKDEVYKLDDIDYCDECYEEERGKAL